jgi:nucleoside-triphosphatase
MAKNVLITGAPGIGKTTLIKHLIRDLTPLIVRGFYKEEILENNIIKGYRVITVNLHELILAHVYFEGPVKTGPFGVNLDGFEKLVETELNTTAGTELFVIDEISRIECLSQIFCHKVIELLDSDIPVVATIAQGAIPELKKLKQRKDLAIIQVKQKNRDSLWKNILLEIQ